VGKVPPVLAVSFATEDLVTLGFDGDELEAPGTTFACDEIALTRFKEAEVHGKMTAAPAASQAVGVVGGGSAAVQAHPEVFDHVIAAPPHPANTELCSDQQQLCMWQFRQALAETDGMSPVKESVGGGQPHQTAQRICLGHQSTKGQDVEQPPFQRVF
jgi:hypothetical protein